MRTVFDTEHEDFRQSVRSFIERECTPYSQEWEEAGQVSREVWLKAGEAFSGNAAIGTSNP